MGELRASDEVLIAATKLAKGDPNSEFTEWELTIEVWKTNKNRWGLRGFEEDHPDHKRVMMEIMGGGGLVKERFLDRSRKNRYRVTSAGFARALAIVAPRDVRERNVYVYDDVKEFAFHRVFEAYLRDPDEPKTWLGVASFLNLSRNDPDLLESQLARIRMSVHTAERFMDEAGRDELRRGDADRTITRERLGLLTKFLSVIEDRFQPQFEAIRRKAKK
jgi:hypothetical protein